MPSARRFRVFGLLLIVVVVMMLYLTSSSRHDRDFADSQLAGDFYARTKEALSRKPGTPGAGLGRQLSDSGVPMTMQERLKEAAVVAKEKANAKAPKPDTPASVVGVGNAAEGVERVVAGRKKGGADAQKPVKEETEEDHEIEVELNLILRKSPIIIFSKSYCPHSKRAKDILLEKYIINPEPFVVELDKHPLGLNLQGKLQELTGRRTVPNILINGVSIGGGDEIAELDETKSLVGKVKDLGGKRMKEVILRSEKQAETKAEKSVDKNEQAVEEKEEELEGHDL